MIVYLIENKKVVIIDGVPFVQAEGIETGKIGEFGWFVGEPETEYKGKGGYQLKVEPEKKVKFKKGRNGRLSVDQKEAMVIEVKEGKSVAEVSKQFKVTPWTVYMVLKKAGIKNPKKSIKVEGSAGQVAGIKNFKCDEGHAFTMRTDDVLVKCPRPNCGASAESDDDE